MTETDDCLEQPVAADPNWLTTREAAELLSVSELTLYRSDEIRQVLAHKSIGKAPQGAGLLWYRPDIERLIELRNHYRLRTRTAARMIAQDKVST